MTRPEETSGWATGYGVQIVDGQVVFFRVYADSPFAISSALLPSPGQQGPLTSQARAELRRARLADPLGQPEVWTIREVLKDYKKPIMWLWWLADCFEVLRDLAIRLGVEPQKLPWVQEWPDFLRCAIEVVRSIASDRTAKLTPDGLIELGRLMTAIGEARRHEYAGEEPPPRVSGKRFRSWKWAVENAMIQILHHGVVPWSIKHLFLGRVSPPWSKEECRALIIAMRGQRTEPGALREARKRADSPDAVKRATDYLADLCRSLGVTPNPRLINLHVTDALQSERIDPFAVPLPLEVASGLMERWYRHEVPSTRGEVINTP